MLLLMMMTFIDNDDVLTIPEIIEEEDQDRHSTTAIKDVVLNNVIIQDIVDLEVEVERKYITNEEEEEEAEVELVLLHEDRAEKIPLVEVAAQVTVVAEAEATSLPVTRMMPVAVVKSANNIFLVAELVLHEEEKVVLVATLMKKRRRGTRISRMNDRMARVVVVVDLLERRLRRKNQDGSEHTQVKQQSIFQYE